MDDNVTAPARLARTENAVIDAAAARKKKSE